MNKILITCFGILLVPFLGLPSEYDRWLYVLLALALLYFVYSVLKNVQKKEVVRNPVKVASKKRKVTKKKITKKKSDPLISQEEKDSIKQAVEKSNS